MDLIDNATLGTVDKCDSILRNQSKIDEAKALYERAMAVLESALGRE